ncbi:MAG TPA: peptidylprolyl isomerase [Armatimonadota bacterium]|nr:peptidylprolyl isomerase [Armatimonadota bacterium]
MIHRCKPGLAIGARLRMSAVGIGVAALLCAGPIWAAKPAAHGRRTAAHPIVILRTSLGAIKCELFPEIAPKAVSNFIGLATGTRAWTDPLTGKMVHRSLYNGTVFHRVIPGFMIQGGDPLGKDPERAGTGGPGYTFGYEVSPNVTFDKPGRLAMAHSNVPDSNGSQFFITTDTDSPATYLNGQYTIFGQVISGQSVVDKISKVARDDHDRPLRPVVLEKVSIVKPALTPSGHHASHK